MLQEFSKVDRYVLRLLAFAALLFWALPLAVGIWLQWGLFLQFTIWDGFAFTILVTYAVYEMFISSKKVVAAL